MRKRRILIIPGIILVLVLLILARCQTDAPQEFPDPRQFDADTLASGPDLPEVQVRPGQTLVAEQIVVIGGGADIDLVIGDLPELALEQLSSTSYDYLEQYPPPERDGDIRQQTQGKRLHASTPLQQASALRVDLYQFTAATPSLSDTLQQIAAKVEERQSDLEVGVVAEPNYVMGFQITGDPWAIEGSPWAIEGSPWAIEGSSTNASSYSSDYFWEQWALQPLPGINLFASDTPPAGRSIDSDGDDVQVAVFDTSPFEAEGGYSFDGWGPPEIDPLALTVSHPVALPTSLPEQEGNISDHGLFVSGLIYAVAPASDIHLIRVLNDEGQGTLQGLIDAFNLYMQQRLAAQGTLQNTVINLSLGKSDPSEEELPPEAQRAIDRMLELWGYTPMPGDRRPVISMEIPILIADLYGASIVAASGNDSAAETDGTPLSSQIPAAYPLVVGVQAGNRTPARSCYANEGDLMAPGGDGDTGCVPAHTTCPTDSDSGDCDFGVTSYALVAHKGFAYWVGTSFATPLVSGLAADVIQAKGSPSPDEVQAALLCSAQASGVVDAVAATSSCP